MLTSQHVYINKREPQMDPNDHNFELKYQNITWANEPTSVNYS